MSSAVKKICVDSRFANVSSESNSNFRFELTESFHIPDNTVLFVTDVCIPRSWYSVEYYNENLYLRMTNTTTTQH